MGHNKTMQKKCKKAFKRIDKLVWQLMNEIGQHELAEAIANEAETGLIAVGAYDSEKGVLDEQS